MGKYLRLALFLLAWFLSARTEGTKTTTTDLDFSPSEIFVFSGEEAILSTTTGLPTAELTPSLEHSISDPVVLDASIAKIITFFSDFNTSNAVLVLNLRIKGTRLGRSRLAVNVTSDVNGTTFTASADLNVISRRDVTDVILNCVLALLVAVVNFGFGCRFDYAVAQEMVRMPRPTLVGVASHCVVLPLVGAVRFPPFKSLENAQFFALNTHESVAIRSSLQDVKKNGVLVSIRNAHVLCCVFINGRCFAFLSNARSDHNEE